MAYEPKTRPTDASVEAFLARVPKEETRRDCATLVKMMKRVTGAPAVMWGPGIVGFGAYHYVYASGAEGDWPLAAFSPRKQDLTVYVMAGFERHPALVKKLGKVRTSKSCLYLKSLAGVDLAALEELVAASVAHMPTLYPAKGKAAGAKKKATAKKVAKKKAVRKPAQPAKR